ncbi:MAG: DUF4190 domain-containing protein [Egibacteraceae bacterium]
MTYDPDAQREGADAEAPPPSRAPAVPGGPGYVVYQQATNGLAVASLVLGIIWIWWIGSILALIFGYVAKSQIDQSEGRQTGRGLAVAGIALGWVGVGVLLLFIVIGIGASSGP